MQGLERQEHLLACLAEECGEVAQVVGKCLRFGVDDYHPKTGNVPNIELLRREFNDLVAVAEMLGIEPSREDMNAKQTKVAQYMTYAQKVKGHHIPVLSKEERHVLQHSLGGEKQYRNHFCTDEDTTDYPVCEGLVEKGLMRRRKAAQWQGGGLVYQVTDRGKRVAFA